MRGFRAESVLRKHFMENFKQFVNRLCAVYPHKGSNIFVHFDEFPACGGEGFGEGTEGLWVGAQRKGRDINRMLTSVTAFRKMCGKTLPDVGQTDKLHAIRPAGSLGSTGGMGGGFRPARYLAKT